MDRKFEDSTIDLQEHLFLTSPLEVRQICEPLFRHFNTSYFNFVRRYINGSEVCLTTDPQWTEFFYKNKLYKNVIVDRFAQQKFVVHKLKVIPWFPESPARIAQSKYFGVGIGMSIIFTHDEYADFFHFGTRNENTEMQTHYFSYADCLVNFAQYFYDRAAKVISLASKQENRLFLPDRVFYKRNSFAQNLPNFDVDNFLEMGKPKRFLIQSRKMGNVFISSKEMACIVFLTYGKTAREIAKILNRSERTVETHLKNVKQKLGLETGANKSDLIKEIYKCGFDLHEMLILPLRNYR